MNTPDRRTRTPLVPVAAAAVILLLSLNVNRAIAANWSVSDPINDLLLDTSSAGFVVGEMSGVTYLGSSNASGKHRFAAVQDSSADVVLLDAAFTLTGELTSAKVVGRVTLDALFDFEGVVAAGDSLFVSEENGPGVREYDFATGNQLQSVAIPTIFTDNARSNKGFESLARNTAGTKMWTANEEALTVDGPIATTSQGTAVRILEFDVNGSNLTPAAQYAYEVEPIHPGGIGPSLRGLSELVSLPDGTLLALERSFFPFAGPTYLINFYELDFAGVSDVSLAPFDDGFDGESPTPVGKEELWSGEVGAAGGENLEGLTVGPRLPNGNWVLLGVVDDGDGIFSSNTIVSFELEPTTPIPFGPETADFDKDGDTDGKDFLMWQRGVNLGVLAGLGDGDASQNGIVDGADLAIWEGDYGMITAPTITADFDQDGDVDGADHIAWQRGFGNGSTLAEGDSDGSMSVDGVDHANWESMFGEGVGPLGAAGDVPEPGSVALVILAAGMALVWRQ